ncbi:MAG: dTMP kinase [Chloroflexi bacterium]|nr:dTMP kinase [Chloroflexota bacterium]
MSPAGLFLSFEGGEGSGKSVQARALADWLRSNGREVVLTREPGGTLFGERVREVLLHAKDVSLAPAAQALLFSAARAQLVAEVIRPALAAGAVVVADRFFDSTLAYQGYGYGADLAGLMAITRFATADLRPRRTFLLDVPVDVGSARRAARRSGANRWDRFESDGRQFHDRLRAGYLELAAADTARFVLVPGERALEVIAAEIQASVAELLVPSRS